ncbi:MAG TPA: TraR/DksA family transcriptional regulator [Candidatus Glassbacteria bacterium]|nr:TraR/DksA family transcriptional regulator [Candidatus Glassbacteria bacterium]
MNKMDVEKYKVIIEDKMKELFGYIVDTEVDEDGDEIDLAQGSFLSSMAYFQRDRNNDKIALLDEALNRINNKTYGYCEECGEEIGRKRLDVFPEAQYCIRCAENIERGNKSFR